MKQLKQPPFIRITFTKEGFASLNEEVEKLTQERPLAVENLKKARELGDLKENGYYKASRARLSFIDSRLLHLKSLVKRALVVDNPQTDLITLGCKVILDDGKTKRGFQLVNKYETDPQKGKVSDMSPIGKALMGKRKGDEVLITIPAGTVTYRIVEISN